jgi:hypothetical protein
LIILDAVALLDIIIIIHTSTGTYAYWYDMVEEMMMKSPWQNFSPFLSC